MNDQIFPSWSSWFLNSHKLCVEQSPFCIFHGLKFHSRITENKSDAQAKNTGIRMFCAIEGRRTFLVLCTVFHRQHNKEAIAIKCVYASPVGQDWVLRTNWEMGMRDSKWMIKVALLSRIYGLVVDNNLSKIIGSFFLCCLWLVFVLTLSCSNRAVPFGATWVGVLILWTFGQTPPPALTCYSVQVASSKCFLFWCGGIVVLSTFGFAGIRKRDIFFLGKATMRPQNLLFFQPSTLMSFFSTSFCSSVLSSFSSSFLSCLFFFVYFLN